MKCGSSTGTASSFCRTSAYPGVVSPLPATEKAFYHAILERRYQMTEADRNRPEKGADNDNVWWERYTREHDAAVDSFNRRWLPTRYNASGHHHWWGTTGHTAASTIEAAHRHAFTGNATQFRLMPVVFRCHRSVIDASGASPSAAAVVGAAVKGQRCRLEREGGGE